MLTGNNDHEDILTRNDDNEDILTANDDDHEGIFIRKRAIWILWIFSLEMRTNNSGMRTSRISFPEMMIISSGRSSLARGL